MEAELRNVPDIHASVSLRMTVARQGAHIREMNIRGTSVGAWKSIRLELARSPDFPDGSASRAYMLCLPLYEDGTVDEAALNARPIRATIKRFWPNQPDMDGNLVRERDGWRFSYAPRFEADNKIVHLSCDRLCIGEIVSLTKADGNSLLFRVESARSDSVQPLIASEPGGESNPQSFGQT